MARAKKQTIREALRITGRQYLTRNAEGKYNWEESNPDKMRAEEAAARAIWNRAMAGDLRAFEMICNQIYGTPPQSVSLDEMIRTGAMPQGIGNDATSRMNRYKEIMAHAEERQERLAIAATKEAEDQETIVE